MQQKLIKLSILLLIAIIPLKIQAGITMNNMLEFIFDKSELGELEQAKLSLSEDGSAWGLKFKQATIKHKKEIWRVGIYIEGNFRLLKEEFIIGENEKLEGPILSPHGKRWGLIYQKNNECYIMINLEKFGPFKYCEKLKFSAIDNFSFIATKKDSDKKQFYSRGITQYIIDENNQSIHAFIPTTDNSKLPKMLYSPDGSHWLLAACTSDDKCYVQEKGNNPAKGPYQTINNIYYLGSWRNTDRRAWAIIYLNGYKEQIFIKIDNEEQTLQLFNDGFEIVEFAHSPHQSKAWGYIYNNSEYKNSIFINTKNWLSQQTPTHTNIESLSFAPNGNFFAFSYRESMQQNWKIDIYPSFTANACQEVECDFDSIEQLTISNDPKQFWGYVGIDTNKKQYLVMYKHKNHFRTLGPFKDIQGPYITPDGHSWGISYKSSYDDKKAYYIYDRYAGLSKYEGMSSGSDLLFSSDSSKLLWGFVYKGRTSHNENKNQYYVIINGTKITSKEDKLGGFSHAHLTQLKKAENTKVFSLVYLDKINYEGQKYRVRVNKIEQPYITVKLKQAWETSHTPNVGYQKVLQIGAQDFCQNEEQETIERVCIKDLKSSKIAALRLFFRRLGLERQITKLEIHECNNNLQCNKQIISASQLLEFIEEKKGITNYSVNKSNYWLNIPIRRLPIQISYTVKADFELLGHSRLEYPFGYEITRIEYIPVETTK
ncbi:hypothetical protein [Candidatus Marithrix sp. Canyon 246]|uniref:hypothetical protein n=1 Tax=Candidatus Marithrix sp. Canyon 246 TaxID=1827136 RepID=UPI00084A176B|nr:hypothetical protein [Candidatus Marithrix sp. Canyon 246]